MLNLSKLLLYPSIAVLLRLFPRTFVSRNAKRYIAYRDIYKVSRPGHASDLAVDDRRFGEAHHDAASDVTFTANRTGSKRSRWRTNSDRVLPIRSRWRFDGWPPGFKPVPVDIRSKLTARISKHRIYI